jgi:hypothetical protein
MLLKLTFSDRIAHINKSMHQIMEASNGLKGSEAIKEFLNVKLSFNYSVASYSFSLLVGIVGG